jgi:DNA mismatch repair protein MutL
MPLIHILDDQTANQIAAGEVVERPVNAVKELVENSIDAGSRSIEVEIAEGGLAYIRISDDGCGMEKEDLSLSVERHATSKISTADNIYHIASLGFRGEALASIASVSRMKITARIQGSETAQWISVEGSHITDRGETGAPQGTTVEIRDLFYNVPARKKFLKSERTESGRINTMLGKLAMANPGIAFRLINNGRTVIETPGNGRLLDVLSALYGIDTAGEMLPVSGEEVQMDGFISKPSLLKSSRQYQTFIVNRRVVDNPLISKAMDNAYHSLLPKNGYPVAVLHLRVPPETIDVNVHPQKREIKFSDEQEIFRAVYHSVLRTLTTQSEPEEVAASMIRVPGHDEGNSMGTFLSGKAGDPVLPGHESPSAGWAQKTQPAQNTADPAARTWSAGQNPLPPSMEMERKEILSGNSVLREEIPVQLAAPLFEEKEGKPEDILVPLGQVADCFIVCSRGKDLFIIDQHAAHERIRYDRLAAHAGRIPSQQVLVPYLMNIERQDLEILLGHKEELAELGLSFETAGPDVIRMTAVPEDLTEADIDRVIHDLLIAFQEKDIPSPETMRHRMLAYAACRGAIKAGDPLNIRQMKELIADLFHTSRPFVCPHGRPVIVRFTPDELGRLFHRT